MTNSNGMRTNVIVATHGCHTGWQRVLSRNVETGSAACVKWLLQHGNIAHCKPASGNLSPSFLQSIDDLIVDTVASGAEKHVAIDIGCFSGSCNVAAVRLVLLDAGAHALETRGELNGKLRLLMLIGAHRNVFTAPASRISNGSWPKESPRTRGGLFAHQTEIVNAMREIEQGFHRGRGADIVTDIALGSTGYTAVCNGTGACVLQKQPPHSKTCEVSGSVVACGARTGKTVCAQAFVSGYKPLTNNPVRCCENLLAALGTLVIVNRMAVTEWVSAIYARAPNLQVVALATIRDWTAASVTTLRNADIVIVSNSLIDGPTYKQRASRTIEMLLDTRPLSVAEPAAVLQAADVLQQSNSLDHSIPLEVILWPRLVVDDAHLYAPRGGPDCCLRIFSGFKWFVQNHHTAHMSLPLVTDAELTYAQAVDANVLHVHVVQPPVFNITHVESRMESDEQELLKRLYAPSHADESTEHAVLIATRGHARLPCMSPADATVHARQYTEGRVGALEHASNRLRSRATVIDDPAIAEQLLNSANTNARAADVYRTRGAFLLAQIEHVHEHGCPICYDETPASVVFASCGHGMCYRCFQRVRIASEVLCPQCRRNVGEGPLYRVHNIHSGVFSGPIGSRARALGDTLGQCNKAIVWFSNEELMRAAYDALGVLDHQVIRLHGNEAARTAQLHTFACAATPVTLCMSIHTEFNKSALRNYTDVILYNRLRPADRERALSFVTPLPYCGVVRAWELVCS